MQIWVDADACPLVIKEILFRAADRAQIVTTLVANTLLRVPSSPFIKSVRVAKGFNVADHQIVEQIQPGDLVITADIPLAAEVITRGARALDPRGELYSEDNVRERLPSAISCKSCGPPAISSAGRRRSIRATDSASPTTSIVS